MGNIISNMSYEKAIAAIRKNDVEAIKKYLKKRQESEPDINDWSDYNLLLKAVNQRRERIAFLLLESGCRINKSTRANSPLHIAIMKQCRRRLIEELLLRDARILERNRKDQTALHLAFLNQSEDDVIDLLIKESLKASPMNFTDKQGLSFLHIVCTRPGVESVRRLVEHGLARVNCKVALNADLEYAGCTPLHFAVENNRIEVAELVLSYGADIYAKDEYGSTPLHFAVEHRNIPMIDLLLLYDDLRRNSINRFGLSHFMAACAGTDDKVVEEFIEKAGPSSSSMINAYINPGSYDYFYPNSGYTSLHFAAEYGRTSTVRLLLDLGADCCALTVHRLSPHNLALGNNHQTSSNLIEDHCAERLQQSLLKRCYENCERYFVPIRDEEAAALDNIMASSFMSEVKPLTFEYLLSPMDMNIDPDFEPSASSTPVFSAEFRESINDCSVEDYCEIARFDKSVIDCAFDRDNVDYLQQDDLVPLDRISETFLKNFGLKSTLI